MLADILVTVFPDTCKKLMEGAVCKSLLQIDLLLNDLEEKNVDPDLRWHAIRAGIRNAIREFGK